VWVAFFKFVSEVLLEVVSVILHNEEVVNQWKIEIQFKTVDPL